DIDVLILHGGNRYFVEEIQKYLIQDLDLSTYKVIDIPDDNISQDEKVDLCIKHSKSILVLLSFDDEIDNSTSARPNLYDEISRIKNNKDCVHIFQEVKNNNPVKLPSNLDSKISTTLFSKSAVDKLKKDIKEKFINCIKNNNKIKPQKENGSFSALRKFKQLYDIEFSTFSYYSDVMDKNDLENIIELQNNLIKISIEFILQHKNVNIFMDSFTELLENAFIELSNSIYKNLMADIRVCETKIQNLAYRKKENEKLSSDLYNMKQAEIKIKYLIKQMKKNKQKTAIARQILDLYKDCIDHINKTN
ncbi:MAG TPA: hypothetical protein VJY62_13535, partial [Bacteroidia bacterium]|nr:hypothetical protein [Bacteroidia bacterium]